MSIGWRMAEGSVSTSGLSPLAWEWLNLAFDYGEPEILAGLGRGIAAVIRSVSLAFDAKEKLFVGQGGESPAGNEKLPLSGPLLGLKQGSKRLHGRIIRSRIDCDGLSIYW